MVLRKIIHNIGPVIMRARAYTEDVSDTKSGIAFKVVSGNKYDNEC